MQALRLPKGVSSRHGATVEPLSVGLHAVEKGRVKLGDRVLVIGAGPIGLAVVAFARLAGAYQIVTSEYAENRRNTSLAFGATGTIDPVREEIGEAFAKIAGGPPDVIFECVGVPGLLQSCINLSAPYGRIVIVGVCMVEDKMIPMTGIFKEVNVQFVLGYAKPDWRLVLNLMDAGKLDPEPMITNVFGLEELPAQFEALRKPVDQIKLLVDPIRGIAV
ncbi:MAG: zinc-binding dehydrogenase [Panacagrimonas sp.]